MPANGTQEMCGMRLFRNDLTPAGIADKAFHKGESCDKTL